MCQKTNPRKSLRSHQLQQSALMMKNLQNVLNEKLATGSTQDIAMSKTKAFQSSLKKSSLKLGAKIGNSKNTRSLLRIGHAYKMHSMIFDFDFLTLSLMNIIRLSRQPFRISSSQSGLHVLNLSSKKSLKHALSKFQCPVKENWKSRGYSILWDYKEEQGNTRNWKDSLILDSTDGQLILSKCLSNLQERRSDDKPTRKNHRVTF